MIKIAKKYVSLFLFMCIGAQFPFTVFAENPTELTAEQRAEIARTIASTRTTLPEIKTVIEQTQQATEQAKQVADAQETQNIIDQNTVWYRLCSSLPWITGEKIPSPTRTSQWSGEQEPVWDIANPWPDGKMPVSLVLYKRDLTLGATTALNMAAIYYLYKTIYDGRIEFVTQQMITHADEFIKLCDAMEKAPAQDKTISKETGFFANMFRKSEASKSELALAKFVEEKFNYLADDKKDTKWWPLKYVPFLTNVPLNSSVILPALTVLLARYATPYINSQFLTTNFFKQEYWMRYEQVNGHVKEIRPEQNISVLPIILGILPQILPLAEVKHDPNLIFMLPFLLYTMIIMMVLFTLGEVAYNYIGPDSINNAMAGNSELITSMNFPALSAHLFSPQFVALFDLILILSMASVLDTFYKVSWQAQVMKNWQEGKKVLEEYMQCKQEKNGTTTQEIQQKLAAAQKKVEAFVKRGNSITINLANVWIKAINMQSLHTTTLTLVSSYLYFKFLWSIWRYTV